MESKVKLFGHPVHPMLIVVPLGLLSIAVVFDILYGLTQDTVFAQVSFYNIVAGLIGGLAAALFGFLDWRHIPDGTRAKRIGLLHALGNVVVLVLFFLSLLMRANAPDRAPETTAFVLALVAVAFASVSGWLGGELVDRLAVGIDRGANVNAPSSLSGKPADMTQP